MKHKQNLMKAIIESNSKRTYSAIVDKYSGNRYKVIKCAECPQMEGRFLQYHHGIVSRSKLTDSEKEALLNA